MPFLPFFDDVSGAASARILKRSGFAADDDWSFSVVGGKSGKKRQWGWQRRQGSGKVCGKSGNVWARCSCLHDARFTLACRRGRRVCVSVWSCQGAGGAGWHRICGTNLPYKRRDVKLVTAAVGRRVRPRRDGRSPRRSAKLGWDVACRRATMARTTARSRRVASRRCRGHPSHSEGNVHQWRCSI